MGMTNLLVETRDILREGGKDDGDVRWVGSSRGSDWYATWENFVAIADIEYDAGYGTEHVAVDLIVVGDDWYLERHEYDGSEWWEFKSLPIQPPRCVTLQSVTGEWGDEGLAELNKGIL
jgi:hypothetical protein